MDIKHIKCHYCRNNNSSSKQFLHSAHLISSRLPVVRWSTRHCLLYCRGLHLLYNRKHCSCDGLICFIWTFIAGLGAERFPCRRETGFISSWRRSAQESLLQLWIVNTLLLTVLIAWLRCWKETIIRTVNGWKYLRTLKMWFIFRTSINCLSFISPGCQCVFNLTEALLLRVPRCLSHTYRRCSSCTIFSSPPLCQKGELTETFSD